MGINTNLIYDVGLHTGEDTAYYLKKGYEVVAFEANPEMISFCKTKFAAEIKENRLTIVEGAIVDKISAKEDKITFYKNDGLSVWSTVVEEFSEKYKELGSSSTIIEVPTVDFEECLSEFGIPYYLKIDIEGMDFICLKALLAFETKPAYVSIEAEKIDFLQLRKEFNLLERLGYHHFQIINQASVNTLKEPKHSVQGESLDYNFEMGSTGLFGSDFSNEWFDKKKALRKFKNIYRTYWLWGETSPIKDYFLVELLRKMFSVLSGRPMNTIPGWYDTHARHASFDTTQTSKSV